MPQSAVACLATIALALGVSASESARPQARWDEEPHGKAWTEAAQAALAGPAAALLEVVPADIETWCPSYQASGPEEREAFWVAFVSSLAMHESTWREDVSGGENEWHGLLQILSDTAEAYGCEAPDPESLKNGENNITCGLRIMAKTVVRDDVIARDGKGVAADWAPFSQEEKLNDMIEWAQTLEVCSK